MPTARAYVSAIFIALWLGAFTFYAAVVVPSGAVIVGGTTQGFVTREVTLWLNVLSCLTAVTMVTDLSRNLSWRRLSATLLFITAIPVLWYLHGALSSQMDVSTRSIAAAESFYELHRTYLILSTLQWSAAIYWLASLGKESCSRHRTQVDS
jgi:hypothetical protein